MPNADRLPTTTTVYNITTRLRHKRLLAGYVVGWPAYDTNGAATTQYVRGAPGGARGGRSGAVSAISLPLSGAHLAYSP